MSEMEFTKWVLCILCVAFLGMGALVHHRGDHATPLFITSVVFGVIYIGLSFLEDNNDRGEPQ